MDEPEYDQATLIKIADLGERVAVLRAGVALLIDTLRACEWSEPHSREDAEACPLCGRGRSEGHKSDCKIARAISSTEPLLWM